MSKLFSTINIYLDEIVLKGKNKGLFLAKLKENLELEIKNVKIRQESMKFVLEDIVNVTDCLGKIKQIPGIALVAPSIKVKTDLVEIMKVALSVVEYYKPQTFKITTTRSYKKFELQSNEISQQVGGYVLKNYDGDLKVDVKNPELNIKIEIDKYKSYILGKKEKCVGGLPVGSSGKVVCLLSGGIDSSVSAYQMMKRGAEVVFVHFHNQSINQGGVEKKIKKLVDQLSNYQSNSKLYIVPFAELQKEIIANVPADMRMIVYKRTMFKLAEKVRKMEGAGALVTGDSLSQVASQTMENLQVIYKSVDSLKLAPLMGFNKLEIIELARKIGTYDISNEPYEDCCSLMLSPHPQTKAKLSEVEKVEQNMKLDELIAKIEIK